MKFYFGHSVVSIVFGGLLAKSNFVPVTIPIEITIFIYEMIYIFSAPKARENFEVNFQIYI